MFIPQMGKVDKVNEVLYEEVKAPNDLNQTGSFTQPKENELEMLTNDIDVENGKEHQYLWSFWLKFNTGLVEVIVSMNFLLGLCTLFDMRTFSSKSFLQRRTTFCSSSCCRQAG